MVLGKYWWLAGFFILAAHARADVVLLGSPTPILVTKQDAQILFKTCQGDYPLIRRGYDCNSPGGQVLAIDTEFARTKMWNALLNGDKGARAYYYRYTSAFEPITWSDLNLIRKYPASQVAALLAKSGILNAQLKNIKWFLQNGGGAEAQRQANAKVLAIAEIENKLRALQPTRDAVTKANQVMDSIFTQIAAPELVVLGDRRARDDANYNLLIGLLAAGDPEQCGTDLTAANAIAVAADPGAIDERIADCRQQTLAVQMAPNWQMVSRNGQAFLWLNPRTRALWSTPQALGDFSRADLSAYCGSDKFNEATGANLAGVFWQAPSSERLKAMLGGAHPASMVGGERRLSLFSNEAAEFEAKIKTCDDYYDTCRRSTKVAVTRLTYVTFDSGYYSSDDPKNGTTDLGYLYVRGDAEKLSAIVTTGLPEGARLYRSSVSCVADTGGGR